MSTRSGESTEENVNDNRPTPTANGQWNQQTIVDARNVLQTQQSNESSQQMNEQRSGKSKKNVYSRKFDGKYEYFSCETTDLS